MRRIPGLSREDQLALIDLMADLQAKPGLDVEIVRRADWLKQGLQGRTFEQLRLATPAAA